MEDDAEGIAKGPMSNSDDNNNDNSSSTVDGLSSSAPPPPTPDTTPASDNASTAIDSYLVEATLVEEDNSEKGALPSNEQERFQDEGERLEESPLILVAAQEADTKGEQSFRRNVTMAFFTTFVF